MDCAYAHQNSSSPLISYNPSVIVGSTVASSAFSHNLIPLGFPPSLTSDQAWYASEFVNEDRYILHLSDDEKDELDAALVFFKGTFHLRLIILY